MHRWVLSGVSTVAIVFTASADVWYVDIDNASGTQDGTSWPAAFTTMQPAIDAAYNAAYSVAPNTHGSEVWVAEGVYDEQRTSDPHETGENTASVMMKEGVHLYGGFAGNESERNQRDWETYVTTINGSTARNGHSAFHVIVGANDSTLDGFTITGGNANGISYGMSYGGGMYNSGSSPTVANCKFSDNFAYYNGGGMCNSRSSPTVTNCEFLSNSASDGAGMLNDHEPSPTVTNCAFLDNHAESHGGGMLNWAGSSPTVTNCAFSLNSAGGNGGGMYNWGGSSPAVANCEFFGNSAGLGGGIHNIRSAPTINNSTFSSNSSGLDGGGMLNSGSLPIVTNCTFSSNSAARNGGGMANLDLSSPTVTNCILWSDSPDEIYSKSSTSLLITYCDIQGGYTGDGNIDADPQFVNAAVGNLHLKGNSPCIDAGTATGAPADDLDGESRPFDIPGFGADSTGTEYDIGADEFIDVDGDGMPDEWEVANALSPEVDDAQEDPDQDGYANIAEFLNGTDPNTADEAGEGEGEGEGEGPNCAGGTISTNGPFNRGSRGDMLLMASVIAVLLSRHREREPKSGIGDLRGVFRA